MHSNMTCSRILESIPGKNPINVSNVVSGTDFLNQKIYEPLFRFPPKSGYFFNLKIFLTQILLKHETTLTPNPFTSKIMEGKKFF